MSDPVPSSAISDATTGGLSVIVITGGSTGQVLTLQANGTYAPATASSGSPGGSSGQVQYNNAGSFGGMTAVVYAGTGTHVAITSQAAATIPLCVKGAASQSGNLTEWQNSSGTVIISVDMISGANGRIKINGSVPDAAITLSAFGSDGYIDCFSGNMNFRTSGTGRTNLRLDNSTTKVATFNGAVSIGSSTDAAAANSTLYYSTTQSKLVWKDAAGSVNVLY
jgi:hypothetical protein